MRKHFIEEATPIPSINDEELGGLRNTDCDEIVVDMIRRVPTFQACKSSLYRSRAKTTPKLPSFQEEINIDGPFSRTLAGERFLLCTDIMSYARHNFLKQKNVRVLKLWVYVHCYIPPLHFRFPALPQVALFALTFVVVSLLGAHVERKSLY